MDREISTNADVFCLRAHIINQKFILLHDKDVMKLVLEDVH
jgi:hypothetical protein